jgi:hypothetical protein
MTTAELKVIGAGLGRTGTHSLSLALPKLGYGATHHMVENFRLGTSNFWYELHTSPEIRNNETKRVELLKNHMIQHGFHSSVDYPSSPYYKELIKAFPNAKVLLSVRDSPAAWAVSAKNSIFTFHYCTKMSYFQRGGDFFYCFGIQSFCTLFPPFWPVIRMLNTVLEDHAGDLSQDHLERVYEKHVADVILNVPADKLLIYNVKDGWEPLCKFLNVPVPNEPFPKSNETEEFLSRMFKMSIRGWGIFLALICVIGFSGRWVMRRMGNKSVSRDKKQA